MKNNIKYLVMGVVCISCFIPYAFAGKPASEINAENKSVADRFIEPKPENGIKNKQKIKSINSSPNQDNKNENNLNIQDGDLNTNTSSVVNGVNKSDSESWYDSFFLKDTKNPNTEKADESAEQQSQQEQTGNGGVETNTPVNGVNFVELEHETVNYASVPIEFEEGLIPSDVIYTNKVKFPGEYDEYYQFMVDASNTVWFRTQTGSFIQSNKVMPQHIISVANDGLYVHRVRHFAECYAEYSIFLKYISRSENSNDIGVKIGRPRIVSEKHRIFVDDYMANAGYTKCAGDFNSLFADWLPKKSRSLKNQKYNIDNIQDGADAPKMNIELIDHEFSPTGSRIIPEDIPYPGSSIKQEIEPVYP